MLQCNIIDSICLYPRVRLECWRSLRGENALDFSNLSLLQPIGSSCSSAHGTNAVRPARLILGAYWSSISQFFQYSIISTERGAAYLPRASNNASGRAAAEQLMMKMIKIDFQIMLVHSDAEGLNF